MPVIGDSSFEFRVNVTRTGRGISRQNYGLFHDLSGIPPDAIQEFCGVKFAPSGTVPMHG